MKSALAISAFTGFLRMRASRFLSRSVVGSRNALMYRSKAFFHVALSGSAPFSLPNTRVSQRNRGCDATCSPAALCALLHPELRHRAEEAPVLLRLCFVPLVCEQYARGALRERVQRHPLALPREFDEPDGRGVAVRAE